MTADRKQTADELRRRAEALLAESADAVKQTDLKTIKELAHELAVYQAELELQNEELLEAQVDLQETRDRFAALFDHAPVGYVVLDSSGIIRQANNTWRIMVNHPDEDFRGRPFADTIVPDDASIFLARFRTIFRNPVEKQIVVRMKRMGSAPFFAQIEAKPGMIKPRKDTRKGDELMIIVSDVTNLQEARLEIENQRNRLESLMQAIPAPVFFKDKDGRYLGCNPAFETLTGGTQAQIAGRTVHEVWPEKYSSTYRDKDLELLETGGSQQYEFNLVDARGKERDVVFYKSAFEDQSGKIEGLVGVILDITERKAVEESLARHLAFEQAISEVSTCLLSTEMSDKVVTGAMEPLLEATNVSRIYIFENFEDPDDGLCMRQTFEVCAAGVEPEIDNPELQHVVYAQGFGRWRERLAQGEAIQGEVGAFPAEERAVLEPQGIVSMLVLPIAVGGRWWGFIGFDETRQPRAWQDAEVALLKTAAEMLGTFFTRKQAEQEREKLVHNLGERVKELNCVFGVSEAIRTHGVDEKVFEQVAGLIPPGWHYPEITRARIRFDHIEFVSEPFEETEWRQAADILVAGHRRGCVEVYYTEERPVLDEGPFLTDERNLIDGIAHLLGDSIQIAETLEALRESERIMRYIIKHDPNALAVYDTQLRYIAVSDRYLKDYCVAEADVLGKHHYEVFPEMPQRWREVHQRVLAGATERNDDDCFERPDGSMTYNRWECRPLYQADGSIGGMITYTEVTTERKLAEVALKEALLRQQEAVRAGNVGLWDWDLKANTVQYSTEWKRQIGYEEDEIGDSFDEWESRVHPSDLPRTLERVKQMIRDREWAYQVEFRFRHKDGSYRWILAQAMVMTDENGEPVRTLGSHIDITERKRAEAQRQALASIIERSQDFIGVADWGQAAFFVNPAGQRMVGLEGDEEVARTRIQDYFLPEDLPFVDNTIFPTVMQEGRWAGEFRFRHFKTGKAIPVLYDLFLTENPSTGEMTNLATVTRDITERKQAEEALRYSENLFRRVFDLLPVGLWIADKDGTLLQGNPAGVRIWGAEPLVSQEEYGVFKARRLPSGEEIAPDDWALARTVNEGVTIADELLEIDALDGVKRVILNYTSPVVDEAGNTLAAIVMNHDITEQYRAEEALRKSAQRLQAVFSAVDGVPIQGYDKDRRVIFWNPASEKLYGYTRDEAMGRPLEELIIPEEAREAVVEGIRQWHGQGVPIPSGEIELLHKNGELLQVYSNHVMITNNHGDREMFCIDVDLTKIRIVEGTLNAANTKLTLAMEAAGQGLWEWNLITDVIHFDDAALDMLGYQQEDIRGPMESGTWWMGRVHPDDMAFMEERFNRYVLGKEKDYHVEFRLKTNDGGYRWMDSSARLLSKDEAGNPAIVVGIHLDITERKRVEERQKNLATELEEILDALPDAVVYADKDRRIKKVNPSFTRIFGYSQDEILGKKTRIIYRNDEEYIEQGRKRYNPQASQMWEPYEIYHVRKDGTEFISETVGTPVRNAQGEVVGLLGLVRDITEKKQSESENEKLQAQLRQAQKMEAIGTLAGGIAHDFNNLLQAINGYTQLLLMDKSDDDPEYNSLKAIQDAGFRASDLVRQLLLFSRKADSTRRPLELQKEVEQAKTILERTIPKMVNVQVNTGTRLWTINADPVQIEQILLNLGTNASDAMPDGGKLLFEIENTILDDDYVGGRQGAQPGRYVLLSVSDTGQGMDKATIENIFDPFFTTKEIGQGTGLGLASVYGIVKSHGGYITCYSEVGQGTTFKIYFPAIVQPEVEEAKEVEPKPIPRGTETILLVDDEEAIRGFARQVLMKFGYKVFTASTGEEALEVYQNKPEEIDLVITDIGMPGMGGHKFLQKLLQLNLEVKVIIASGYSVNPIVKQSMEAGAKGYVGKPYQLADLLNTVREVLDEED